MESMESVESMETSKDNGDTPLWSRRDRVRPTRAPGG
jgi:hypothetical protein